MQARAVGLTTRVGELPVDETREAVAVVSDVASSEPVTLAQCTGDRSGLPAVHGGATRVVGTAPPA